MLQADPIGSISPQPFNCQSPFLTNLSVDAVSPVAVRLHHCRRAAIPDVNVGPNVMWKGRSTTHEVDQKVGARHKDHCLYGIAPVLIVLQGVVNKRRELKASVKRTLAVRSLLSFRSSHEET